MIYKKKKTHPSPLKKSKNISIRGVFAFYLFILLKSDHTTVETDQKPLQKMMSVVHFTCCQVFCQCKYTPKDASIDRKGAMPASVGSSLCMESPPWAAGGRTVDLWPTEALSPSIIRDARIPARQQPLLLAR